MANLIRTINDPCPISPNETGPADAEQLGEWIVTNGLGGYASGTVCGIPTRRYHGLLIAALPAPLGRTIMLNQLMERLVHVDGRSVHLGLEALAGRPARLAECQITEFRLEAGLPVWRFEAGDVVLEKRLLIPHLQNTAYVAYHLVGGEARRRAAPAPAPGAVPPARCAGGLAPSRPLPVHRLGRPLRGLGRAGRSRHCG